LEWQFREGGVIVKGALVEILRCRTRLPPPCSGQAGWPRGAVFK